jgi:hypothetical protein
MQPVSFFSVDGVSETCGTLSADEEVPINVPKE